VISLSDVVDARARIDGYVHRTPLIPSRTLSERLGARTHVKLELFQKTGSFKPRGAFNVMLSMPEPDRRRGVVGFSGGNFAQGMAHAGRELGVDTLVVMPETTPSHYVEATRGYGASVEMAPDVTAAIELASAHADAGRTLMHPFDDPRMMAGNGTIGLEILEDVPDLTHLFVSVGGGGLLTGVATAVLAERPGVKIVGVETEGADALARSLAAGEPVTIQPTSIAKTLGSPYAAADVIELAQEKLAGVEVVSDRDAVDALSFLAERVKVLTEPAASCTLAAADRWADRFGPGDDIVLLLCGGNVSVEDLMEWHRRFG
jgi:threonine dehydratase